MYGGASTPSGYLLCDGASVLVADYPDLFAALGYSWGGGGANFSVPDMAQRGPYGPGGGRSVADTDGAETVDISHAHTIPTQADHQHFVPASGQSGNDQGGGSNDCADVGHTHMSALDGSHNHGGATGSGGSGTQDVLNPVAVVNFIIKF